MGSTSTVAASLESTPSFLPYIINESFTEPYEIKNSQIIFIQHYLLFCITAVILNKFQGIREEEHDFENYAPSPKMFSM